MAETHFDIVWIGGGLASLTAASRLAGTGRSLAIVEKREYPFHKVCGEYISNETLPYLRSLGVEPAQLGATSITKLQVSAPSGFTLDAPLGLGGFGISRYKLDSYLHKKGQENGVQFFTATRVQQVQFADNRFTVTLDNGQTLYAGLVVGAYGKRETLDKQLGRDFMNKRTGYMGVKYHIRIDRPDDVIALHNFKDGYCGISQIEDSKFCLCYLTSRENLRSIGNIGAMEEKILWQNPHLKAIWKEAQFLYEKPEVINEISFARKQTVEQHIWMCGDAAGLITPLCGNGMAMAIHGGKILSDLIIKNNAFIGGSVPTFAVRLQMELAYTRAWQAQFSTRLWWGRQIQKLFGNPTLTHAAVVFLSKTPHLLKQIISFTHGKPF